ncbi:MAG: SDR family oxidoreductase [Hyphomicrobiaceae bacterium]
MSRHVTLVTGVSRGIGLATARRLAADGHHVIGLSRSAPPAGTPCEFHEADLADAAGTDALLREITGRHQITGLVNNAGVPVPDKAGEVTLDGFAQVIAVNLRAALQCMQACLPAMRAAKYGRIVNISSRAALGKAERNVYAASKAGIIGLTRTWALELGADGITVNAVAPGPVVTELYERNNSEELIRRTAEAMPLRRLGRPVDIASVIAFFMGPDSSFVTGQTLYACGGMSVGQAPI